MDCPGTIITLDANAASASLVERSDWSPAQAIDHNMETRWPSEFVDDAWFAVDLGAPTLVTSLWLFWERAHSVNYTLEAGEMVDNAIAWEAIATIEGSDGQADIIGAFDGGVSLPVVMQYVRIVSTAKFSGNYGISRTEFEVHGNKDEVCLEPSPAPSSSNPSTAPLTVPTTSTPILISMEPVTDALGSSSYYTYLGDGQIGMGGIMFDVVATNKDLSVTMIGFQFSRGYGTSNPYKVYMLTSCSSLGCGPC
jgi:hypothetical protein